MKLLQNLLVGLLFFGALAIVGHFTIFSTSGPFASQGSNMVLYFDNADGIKAGSKVTVLGVPSGSVADVALVPVDKENRVVPYNSPETVGQRVAITVELRRPVVFYKNYAVAIKSESLLGGKLVAIDPGTALDRKTQKPFERVEIKAYSPQDLANLDTTALDQEMKRRALSPQMAAFTDLQGTTAGDPVAGLAEILEDNRGNVKRTLDNLAQITDKVNNGKGTVGRLINDDELHRNASTLLTDAQIVIKELRESLEDTREQAPVTSFIRAALTAF